MLVDEMNQMAKEVALVFDQSAEAPLDKASVSREPGNKHSVVFQFYLFFASCFV